MGKAVSLALVLATPVLTAAAAEPVTQTQMEDARLLAFLDRA